MLLTCEGWCHLHCKRVAASDPDPPVDSSFSLLPALEDGYFSDLSITASNNKQVQVLSDCYRSHCVCVHAHVCVCLCVREGERERDMFSDSDRSTCDSV
jgi:hypothetical protein